MTAHGFRFAGAIEGLQCPEIEGLQEDNWKDEVQATAPEMGCAPAATLVKGNPTGERHAVGHNWRAERSEWQCQVLIANGADDNITRQRSNARASDMNRAAEDFDEMAKNLRAAALDILARDRASTEEAPLRCSSGEERHALGWSTDRADHRPWSAGRSSSAASAASTSDTSSTKNARDSSRRLSLLAQWGEGPSAAPSPLSSSTSLGLTDSSEGNMLDMRHMSVNFEATTNQGSPTWCVQSDRDRARMLRSQRM